MKMTYRTANGRLTFEMDVQNAKAAFECVAGVQELFEESECGACKSPHIRCDVRDFDGNRYYKLVCAACGAQLDFGQHRDGKGLFIKRNNKDGAKLPNRGWYQYRG